MIKSIALSGAVAALAMSTAACAQTPTTAPNSAAFTLPDLPYAADALASAIDTETMQIHHGRHHKAYVDNLNAAIAATPALAGVPMDKLLAQAGTLAPAVRNNAGGHWNHTFFWKSMAPQAGGAPEGELGAAIAKTFGSFDEFKKQFEAAAVGRFGSGWAWLACTAWAGGRSTCVDPTSRPPRCGCR